MAGIKIDLKFAFNILSLVGALIYGWYQMEMRIATIEMKIENYDKVSKLRDEITELRSVKR
jgi:hypothetical protein|tara:strand:+ start:364 stop:546 length:183 start_codon:yes stop_codon:yes gene_type:complete